MKKSKKQIPSTHLKKYDAGGRATSATGRSAQNAQADPASNGNIDYMNDKRTKGLSTAQYAQLGNSALNAGLSIYNSQNNPNLTAQQKQQAGAGAVNSVADSAIGMVPGFGQVYGMASGASKSVRGMLPTDEYGNIVGDGNKAINEIVTPDHEHMINNFSKGEYGAGVLDLMGIGKFGRMASQLSGNDQKTTGFWGKANDFMGIEPDKTQFAQGGMNMLPNAELEKSESVIHTDGSFTQLNNEPSHKNGGYAMGLEPGAKVFSDRLKLGKKTFAQLNKSNNTNKEDKILEDSKSGNISTRTATLMKMAKLKSSEELFNIQEQLKQDKVAKYAQKMGVVLPTENTNQNQYANGGTVNVNKNTYQYPVIPNNQFDSTKFYNPNTNFVSNVPTQYSYNNIGNTNNTMFPDSNIVNPYKERTQVYKNGGMNLPKYPNGIKYKDGSEDRKTFLENKINNELSTPNYQYYDKTDYKNIPQSSYAPGVLGYNNSLNSPQNPYVKPVDNTDYQKINQDSYDEDLKKGLEDSNVSSNSPSWKNVAGQVGMGLLQNAGNIYNLSRYNTPEIEQYQRAQASYLDPTAAIRDAEQENRRAEVDIRNATSGNSGNYLSNRIALNTKNVLNKDRIRQQYANTNAGISNSINQYNNELARQEVIANAQNRARTRSGKEQAISQIGSNIANQFLDSKKGKMDQDTLELMMKYYDNPEFQKALKESNFNKKSKKTGK